MGTYRRFSSHKTEEDVVQWDYGSWPDGLPKKDGANALSGAGSLDTATTPLSKTSRTKNLIIECKLSDILEEHGLSRRELARLAGVNINTACAWASGDLRTVDLRVLDAICEALQIQPGELLRWVPGEDAERWVEESPSPSPSTDQPRPRTAATQGACLSPFSLLDTLAALTPAQVRRLSKAQVHWLARWYQRGSPLPHEDPVLYADWPLGYSGPKTFCGARTRQGTPCKRRDLRRGRRRRLHGGLSVGPRSEFGKRRSALNGHRPKRWRRRPTGGCHKPV